ARVQLRGDRLDLEWPAVASCAALSARCELRAGAAHESASWTAVAGTGHRFRTRCGPLGVVVELQPGDGCVRVQAEVVSAVAVDVARVSVSARVESAVADLAWVLYNGYQSWDESGHLPAAGGTRESWWTIGLCGTDGSGLAAVAVEAGA